MIGSRDRDRKVGKGLIARDNRETPLCYTAIQQWVAVSCGERPHVIEKATQEDSLVARHSFIVRIWREEGSAGWRGWVQHTGSGESVFVRELGQLLAFIERRTGKLSGAVQKRLK
jgi:hypothetical protein